MSLLDVLHEETGKPDNEHGRFYGFVYGKVTNIDDPDGTGRIKARFGAQRDNEESDWLMPGFPGSMECEPNKDDEVLIAFVDGDPARGIWLATVTKNTKKRASEAAVLGTMFASMYNDLVAKFNTLKGQYQALYTAVCAHSHAMLGASSATLVQPTLDATALNTDANAGKIQDADGSTVAARASDQKALSGKVVLR